MHGRHTRKFRCKIKVLISSLSIALSGTAAAAGTFGLGGQTVVPTGTIGWEGQVLLNGNPLSGGAVSASPSGMILNTQGALGIGVDAAGSLQLDGSGAAWHYTGGDMVIGSDVHGSGTGDLLIRSGARVTQTLGNVVIGQNLNSAIGSPGVNGKAEVSGAGSLLRIDGGDLIVGSSGSFPDPVAGGELTIADQARVLVNATKDGLTGGQVRLGVSGGKNAGNSTLNILNGGLLSAGNVAAEGTANTITFDGGTLVLTGGPGPQGAPLPLFYRGRFRDARAARGNHRCREPQRPLSMVQCVPDALEGSVLPSLAV
ncbi:hypothetical protein CDEF62S_03352 [Castellaniella defragrans]